MWVRAFQRLGFGRSRRGGGLLLEGKFQGGGAVEERRGDVCWVGEEGWVGGIVGKVKGHAYGFNLADEGGGTAHQL